MSKKNPILQQKYDEGYQKGMEAGIKFGREAAIYFFAEKFDGLNDAKGIGPKTMHTIVNHFGSAYFKQID